MKRLNTWAGKLLVLGSALGLTAALAATPGAAVVKQNTDSESIELTNLDDGTDLPTPVATGKNAATAGSDAKADKTIASRTKAGKKVMKKVLMPDGTEEEMLVDAEEDSSNADLASRPGMDGNGGSYGGGTYVGSGYSGGGTSGNSMGSSGYTGNTGVANTVSGGNINVGTTSATNAGSTAANTGSTAATNTGSAAANTASTSASNTGSSGSGSSTGTTPTPTAAASAPIQAKLESYRNAILAEVANAQVTNPALTRRYLQVNRSGYQRMMGL